MTKPFAVIGAGPLGSCAARALAERFESERRPARIVLIDANDPLEQDFQSMSAAGPHAAGQLMLHVFDADSSAKGLTRRSHEILRTFQKMGYIELHSRPWICCTGNSGSALDETAQEVLAQAHAEGRFESCEMVRGDRLEAVVGLRADQVAWALRDGTTMAVNPRTFVQQLARFAVNHAYVEGRFKTRVTGIDGDVILLRDMNGTSQLEIAGLILCTGVHCNLFAEHLPPSRPEYLHVTEHNHADHLPEVQHLITGETTIARYAGFGPKRVEIVPHLDEAVRQYGIHGLFTDLPGLRRMLDSHFDDQSRAEQKRELVWPLLRATIGRYVAPKYLLGGTSSNRSTDASYVASYTKLRDSDGPWLGRLNVPLPAVYAQPSNGLGLNQCAGLGHDAANMLADLTG